MIKTAFICVHNSCRSQIAEALGNLFAGDIMECDSAGTEIKERIDPQAVRIIKKLYNIDMEKTQKPKLLSALPPADIMITMGCNVQCPFLPCKYREDWGLEDPSGGTEKTYRAVINAIKLKILFLKQRIMEGTIELS